MAVQSIFMNCTGWDQPCTQARHRRHPARSQSGTFLLRCERQPKRCGRSASLRAPALRDRVARVTTRRLRDGAPGAIESARPGPRAARAAGGPSPARARCALRVCRVHVLLLVRVYRVCRALTDPRIRVRHPRRIGAAAHRLLASVRPRCSARAHELSEFVVIGGRVGT